MSEVRRWARWATVAVALGVLAVGCSDYGDQVPTVGTGEPGGASSSSTTSTTSASSGGGYGY